LKEAQDDVQSGVALQVQVLQSQAQIAESRHALGSIDDQIADLTNSLNDLIGLPLPTQTELIEPEENSQNGSAANAQIVAPEFAALEHNPELFSARQSLQKAHAGLNAARAAYIPDLSLVLQHTYQNGSPLLPDNSYAVKVRESRAQVAEAEENVHATENKVRMDVESEVRKVNRSETGLEAAREDVAARAELVRITNDQVIAKTATESSLKEAQAQLADAQAQLLDAQMQQVVAQAELIRTEGHQ
jgi:outer membrane protein TolC